MICTTQEADGPAAFSLRPEAIRLASATSATDAVRFKATVLRQVFQGATELFELDCGGTTLNAKIYSARVPAGESEFEFALSDFVPVKESR